MLFLNSTSQDVVSFWGAYSHGLILREFLADLAQADGTTVKVEMVLAPFPLTDRVNQLLQVLSGLFVIFGIGLAYVLISMSMMSNIVREKELNLKNQMRISGVSLPAYWVGLYISDIIFGAITAATTLILLAIFDIDCPDAWVLILLNTFANPAFIYFFSSFFTVANLARQAILFLYLVVGLVLPLVLAFLQFGSETTADVARASKWFFLPCPAFATAFGILQILLRQLLAFFLSRRGEVDADQLAAGLEPFDPLIAGYMLYFLIGCIPVYWLLLAAVEGRVHRAFCRVDAGGAGGTRASAFGPGAVDQDPDIIEEERRVEALAPDNLPVRAAGVKKRFGSVHAVKSISFGLEFGECFALLGVSGAGKTTLFKCLTGEVYPSAG